MDNRWNLQDDEFEYCDCALKEGYTTNIDVFGTKECGCGEKHCREYRDTVIHWKGKHWLIECAFTGGLKIIKELEDYTKRLCDKKSNYTEV